MKILSLPNIAILAAAVAVGFFIGEVIKRQLFGSPQSRVVAKLEHINQSMPNAGLMLTRGKQTLASLEELSTTVAAHAQAAEKPRDFGRLLDRAKGNHDLYRAVAARWAATDPHDMLLKLTDAKLRPVLFETWSKFDPEGMLRTLHRMQRDGTVRSGDLHSAVRYLMTHAPALGIDAIADFGLTNYHPREEGIVRWARSDPKGAALKVMELEDSYSRSKMLSEIGKVWGKEDPEGAIHFARSNGGTLGLNLAASAIRSWAARDPDSAEALLSNESDPVYHARMGHGYAKGLASEDPGRALAWADQNLQSTTRARAIGDVVKAAAREDVVSAAALISEMNPGGAMSQAVDELLGVWSREDTTDGMFQWISELEDDATRQRAIQNASWRIESSKRNGLIDFVSGEHGHLATERIVRRAAEQRTRQDPETAEAWASGLPEDRAQAALSHVARVKETMQGSNAARQTSSPGETRSF